MAEAIKRAAASSIKHLELLRQVATSKWREKVPTYTQSTPSKRQLRIIEILEDRTGLAEHAQKVGFLSALEIIKRRNFLTAIDEAETIGEMKVILRGLVSQLFK